MDAARWDRVQALFHDALALSPDERRGFLAGRCDDDPSLVDDVVALLDADDAGSLLDRGVAAAASDVLDDRTTPLPRGPFGPYRLTRLLGEGGMGVVYLGARDDLGSVAAIKVLRDASLSPSRRERFASEQRTLAQLSHPAIARLYDAGALADGTPWIAMELVEGETLVAYCRAHRLPLRERLRLFRDVCDAVRHAHRHLVIHRDIKPSNVLVTPDGAVKLLDFGIAKQLDTLDTPADATRTGLRLMTPAYAAPEQLLGDAVGTHTDVYALGVVLYELLTGRLPFDLSRRTPGEAESVVLAGEPTRPSIAARGSEHAVPNASAAAWADLDVLCLTAMHRDAARRYATVDGLVRDVDHFLAGEPLQARPDTLRYRAAKFARRHRRPLAASGVAVAALVALVAFYTVRLARARDVAIAESVRTQRIQRFMLDLFQGGDASVGPADSLRVVTIVERGAQEASRLGREPVVQAELFYTLGGILQKLGRLDRADSLLRAALDRRREMYGAEHPDVARSLVALGLLRVDQARLDDAERLVRDGLGMTQRLRAPGDPDVARATNALGRVFEERGAYDSAIVVLGRAVDGVRARNDTSPEAAESIGRLANNHFYAGHYALADSLDRVALALVRRQHGPRHPLVADQLINLGAVQYDQGRYPEAERYYRDAVGIFEPWFGPNDPRTAAALTMLARSLVSQSRSDEAVPLMQRALAIQEGVHGPVHPAVASILNELGTVALLAGRYDESDADFARMADIYRQVYAGNHYLYGIAVANRGSVAMRRGDNARAETLFRQALGIYARTLPPEHLNVGITEVKLGRALLRQRRYRDAEREILAGHAILTRQTSPSVTWIQSARADLATLYETIGQPAKAAEYRVALADSASPARR